MKPASVDGDVVVVPAEGCEVVRPMGSSLRTGDDVMHSMRWVLVHPSMTQPSSRASTALMTVSVSFLLVGLVSVPCPDLPRWPLTPAEQDWADLLVPAFPLPMQSVKQKGCAYYPGRDGEPVPHRY